MLSSITRPKWPKILSHKRLYGTIYPYKKLRAYPFVLPPEEVMARMSPYIKIICGEYGFRDRFFPQALVEIKRPVTIEAVYLPTWLIGGSAVLDLICGKGTPNESPAFVTNYSIAIPIPGCDVPLLSSARVWSHLQMQDNIPLPFTESFLKQQEESIEENYLQGIRCLPFTISPFSVLKLVKTGAGRTLKVGADNVYVKSSSLALFSAMPVLFPMYVAKYEDKDGQSLRAFMEAHTIHASVKLDKFQALAISSKHGNPMPTVTTLSQKGKQYDLSNFDQGIEVTDFGNPFRRLNGSFESDNHQRISVEHVEAYLWSLLGVYENIKKLASMGTLDSDEDTRIREMTAKEMAFREQERQQRDETLTKIIKEGVDKAKQQYNRQQKSKLGVWSKYKASPQKLNPSTTATQKGPTTQFDQKKSRRFPKM